MRDQLSASKSDNFTVHSPALVCIVPSLVLYGLEDTLSQFYLSAWQKADKLHLVYSFVSIFAELLK